MRRKACFVYRWSTFGGIERVFLNRAEAFANKLPEWEVDVFFYSDAGGLEAFGQYLLARNLHNLRVVAEFNPDIYEYIFLFDTPQALRACSHCLRKVVIECHSFNQASRTYLDHIPPGIKALTCPSEIFRERIVNEYPELTHKVHLLRNFVPWDISPPKGIDILPKWRGRPILYFGRIDALKNIGELIVACSQLRRSHGDNHLFLFAGPISKRLAFTDIVKKEKIYDRCVYLPPIQFHKTASFLSAMANIGAIFVSPSKGESFGLSAAESIAAGIPVVLSDIPEHRWLVENDQTCLYPIHDTEALVERIIQSEHTYAASSMRMKQYRSKFSATTFIQDWVALTG